MSDCCGNSNDSEKTRISCPAKNCLSHKVGFKTVKHQVRSPWINCDDEELYYFCTNPDCDIVYFTASEKVIYKNQLRNPVGQKDTSDDAMLCYCFDINNKQARENTDLKSYVTQATRNKQCSCDLRNPSGKCCLKNFPN